ncbi:MULTISPECIES: septation regulator SpoVG [Carboxydocella]|uniref:Putative septation protein SpoVG n=2 Tax=Carboxydocella TaxID=178898 RepID=A0A1T4QIL0_9FIRM|nr:MULTISPECIES: septation regulator SpoVG [Carboxydocella]AVX19267.1 stage V sporulation protein G [Carboxydocella thermautotrophica]AVX29680.1 stage V sporulation protein G [Carboxydocella thermautotrophica]SKA03565.1 stage V sporulation protein G [Carboxydocella sporoproducens DSM 16521]GAW29856.1 putative septation protein SpoVG [Carboxydocella sp. ULO1]GAW32887.1 putative septation protein SpoVG [Carboxydocella sp. JDF658]
MLNITDVRIRKLSPEGKLKAIASVTLSNVFVVHDIKVVEGQKGLFVAMPSRKTSEGHYRDIAHPITSDFRQLISQVVLDAYQQAMVEEQVSA